MKGICIFLAVLACASALTTVDKDWESFKTKFEKQYSEKEEVHRHGIFSKNKKMIEEHNKKFEAGEVTFSMAINKFADLTEEEMNAYKGGKRTAEELKRGTTLHKVQVGASYPDTVDWRNSGYVTGVKDQGQCGSCWAFSTTGSLEGQHFRFTGALISLSEQHLVDCVPGNNCNGGWMDTAFAWIRDNGGVDTEASYPYEAANGACRTNSNIGATVTGYVDLGSGDENALLDASANVGPISVAIDASKSTFSYYGGGVYYDSSCSSTSLDHGVLVVGYGTDNGNAYWLVKNSWGPSWGEAGYIRMARNSNNNCGIATAASYPTV